MVLGSMNFPLMPMIVGAMADHLPFSVQQVGVIASADMFGMFASALFALYWIRRWSWRAAALFFCVGLVACHGLSSQLTDFWQLAAARFAAGFCGGSMMAIGSTLIADTKHPERNVALLTGVQMATAAVGFLVLPAIIESRGAAGVFSFLALLVTPALLAGALIPSAGPWDLGRNVVTSAESGHLSRSAVLVALLVTLPGFLFHLGYGASWAFIERLGVSSGLSLDTVGQALSASFLAGVAGSATAWLLGMKYGRNVPFIVTVIAQLTTLTILAFLLDGVVVFVSALMVYAFFLNFPIPYQIGLAVSLDTTGRAAVLYLLMLKAGIAIAPLLAAQFVVGDDYTFPLMLAALFYSACFAHLIWVQRRFGRSQVLAAEGVA